MATAHARAAERLGRELHPAEQVIDIDGIDRVLTEAKERLTDAIEDEKARAIRRPRIGRAAHLQLTEDMAQVLLELYVAGGEYALSEMAALGVSTPVRAFAIWDEMPDRLLPLLRTIIAALTSLGVSVGREEAKLRFGSGDPVSPLTETFLRLLEERVPGARDIASRVISTAFTAGLADMYERRTDLFPAFRVTAVLDSATCAPCRHDDGREFDTPTEAAVVMANGGWGPNLRCLGDGRCRCRLVPLPPFPTK